MRVGHARRALADAREEANPHLRRLDDALAHRDELLARREALEAQTAEAAGRQGELVELQEHFGKRGVQNMLYTLALAQLESSAAVYADELSGGRLQLRLSFDDALRSVRKRVAVCRADGSIVERSVSQLSGGEWRRIALALSLAFADFSRARLGIGCNLVVFDEVMQHMDIDGQAAMARVLKGIDAQTSIVIAHGLASEALYGDFEAIDVVERAGDTSHVHVHVQPDAATH